ncbi:hypothetical protein [Tuberibacillus sp. Marseille-P3662]|uniref:hypothetical protein n=1 Tax=Tuberibacillus sp. Marseille-P3662 TaxID=1965358 RepID=UPI000A1CAA78|nr:hypothetical protein [Tuberibacillus sp. Marseille-P3662]
MVGCLGIVIFILVIWVWFLIYKYVGHEPRVEGYCFHLGCDFPDDYVRNWFGDIWLYSPLWLPALILVIYFIYDNWSQVKKVITAKKKKILISSLIGVTVVTLFLSVKPRLSDWANRRDAYNQAITKLNEEKYLEAVSSFTQIKGYKDSEQKIRKINSILFEKSPKLIGEGNYVKAINYLNYLSGVPKYNKKVDEMIANANAKLENKKAEFKAEKRSELRSKPPHDGMLEKYIKYSSWGAPTKIELSHNYNAKRPDRRFKVYKWIKRDGGEIIQIKSLMVKQGRVWGEPEISNYSGYGG